MKRIFGFLVKLLVIVSLVFLLHIGILYYLELPLFENKIIASYIVNFLLAVTVLLVIERTIQKKSSQAGFIFMAGSALKFLVFFIVFYPIYRADGEMQTVEFTAFFIPYSICLIADVIYLSKQLNNQPY